MPEYVIDTSDYRGPMAALLDLVESNRYPIQDLPIAEITSQFQTYVSKQSIALDYMAAFITMSARLIVLKSRSLLPQSTSEPAEDIRLLGLELARYQVVQKQVKALKLQVSRGSSFHRPYQRLTNSLREQSRFSLKRLSRAYVQILRRQPQLPQASRTQPISLESINRSLLTSLNIHELQLPLTQPPDHWPEAPLRVLNIITFAAALELNRQNTLIVIQTESFGPITLRLAP